VETIGSKRSYALTWCMPNNDDDDDSSKMSSTGVWQTVYLAPPDFSQQCGTIDCMLKNQSLD